jgi:hypothetical protein
VTEGDPSSAGAPPPGAPRVPRHVRTRRTGDDVVVVDLHTERYYGLDGVGADLWRLLVSGHPIPAAVDQLGRRYDVDTEVLREDVDGLVATLLDRGLLTDDDPGTGVGLCPAVPIATHLEVATAAAPEPAQEGSR